MKHTIEVVNTHKLNIPPLVPYENIIVGGSLVLDESDDMM